MYDLSADTSASISRLSSSRHTQWGSESVKSLLLIKASQTHIKNSDAKLVNTSKLKKTEYQADLAIRAGLQMMDYLDYV